MAHVSDVEPRYELNAPADEGLTLPSRRGEGRGGLARVASRLLQRVCKITENVTSLLIDRRDGQQVLNKAVTLSAKCS